MLVQKLFSTQKKQFTAKPQYKKPVHKSYKELLRLDRPRKKIEYQSQSSDEDFLEKLLNAESQRSKQKKKRRKSLNSPRKGQQQKMKQDQFIKKQEGKDTLSPELKIRREMPTRGGSQQKRLRNQLSLIQEQKHQNVKQGQTSQAFFKSNNREHKTLSKSKQMNGAIYIDNKSMESHPIFYSSANHLFHPSLPDRKNSAYELLIKQKQEYLSQLNQKQRVSSVINQQQIIQHNIDSILSNKFSCRPTIHPHPNWSYNLTVPPKMFVRKREFVDRKTLFRSKDEQERFIQSLRELSVKRK